MAGVWAYRFLICTTDGCLYNGNLYIQDQQWDDGCKLSCVCEDAAAGRYKCRAKYVHIKVTYRFVGDSKIAHFIVWYGVKP